MDIGTSIIITGLMTNAFFIVIYLLSTRTWFLKENFKIQKSSIMGENKLKLKKLERELGVKAGNIPNEPTGNLIDQLKNLDIDKIRGILDLLGQDQELADDQSPLDKIVSMAVENPEIVGKFLGGVKDKTADTTQKYI